MICCQKCRILWPKDSHADTLSMTYRPFCTSKFNFKNWYQMGHLKFLTCYYQNASHGSICMHLHQSYWWPRITLINMNGPSTAQVRPPMTESGLKKEIGLRQTFEHFIHEFFNLKSCLCWSVFISKPEFSQSSEFDIL